MVVCILQGNCLPFLVFSHLEDHANIVSDGIRENQVWQVSALYFPVP